MNKYQYEVLISNPITEPVGIASLVVAIEAATNRVAERMLNSMLDAMFKGEPALEWAYNLINYQVHTEGSK